MYEEDVSGQSALVKMIGVRMDGVDLIVIPHSGESRRCGPQRPTIFYKGRADRLDPPKKKRPQGEPTAF